MTVGEKSEYIGLVESHSQGEDFWQLVIGGIIVQEGIGEPPEDVIDAASKELASKGLLFPEDDLDVD